MLKVFGIIAPFFVLDLILSVDSKPSKQLDVAGTRHSGIGTHHQHDDPFSCSVKNCDKCLIHLDSQSDLCEICSSGYLRRYGKCYEVFPGDSDACADYDDAQNECTWCADDLSLITETGECVESFTKHCVQVDTDGAFSKCTGCTDGYHVEGHVCMLDCHITDCQECRLDNERTVCELCYEGFVPTGMSQLCQIEMEEETVRNLIDTFVANDGTNHQPEREYDEERSDGSRIRYLDSKWYMDPEPITDDDDERR